MAPHIFDLAKDLPPWLMLGVGVVAGWLRSVWSFVYEHTIGYLITRTSLSLTVEDSEHEEAYRWLSSWVEARLKRRRVNALLLRRRNEQAHDDAPISAGFDVIPGYGTYYLKCRGRFMVVDHHKTTQQQEHGRSPVCTLHIRIWLCRKRQLLLDILDDARLSYEEGREKRVDYLRPDRYGDWNLAHVSARPLGSLFHPPSLIHDLLSDVQHFLDSKEMYEELGLPYRRGYLLSRPPGTGKSSLILAVASHFRLPIYALSLSGKELYADLLPVCCRVAGSRRSFCWRISIA